MPRVITKKSAVPGKVPLSTDLEIGELAVNVADAKLFTKNASNTVIELGGGGGGGTPANRAPHDYWIEQYFGTTTAADQVFTGAAVSGGVNTGTLTSFDGIWDYGVFIRSGTTANGGYRYSPTSQITAYMGTVEKQFMMVWKSLTSHTGRTIRAGWIDTTSSADATDGVYFEILDGVARGKTSNNSVRTSAASSFTLVLGQAYLFEISATSTSASFKITNATTDAVVYTETITTNIPSTSARASGAGMIATEATTTASDIGILYNMGFGTKTGYAVTRQTLRGPTGDPGITVSSVAPSSPVLNQLWLQV